MSFCGKQFAVERAVNKVFPLLCQGLSYSALEYIVCDAVPQLEKPERRAAILAAQAVVRRTRKEFRLVRQNLLSSQMLQRERRSKGVQTTPLECQAYGIYSEQDIAQAVELAMFPVEDIDEPIQQATENPPMASNVDPPTDAQAVAVAAAVNLSSQRELQETAAEDHPALQQESVDNVPTRDDQSSTDVRRSPAPERPASRRSGEVPSRRSRSRSRREHHSPSRRDRRPAGASGRGRNPHRRAEDRCGSPYRWLRRDRESYRDRGDRRRERSRSPRQSGARLQALNNALATFSGALVNLFKDI